MASKPKSAGSYKLTEDQQQAVIRYGLMAQSNISQMYQFRSTLTEIDRAYTREQDFTEEQMKALRANMAGDPTKFQNVVVPVVMPQVEAALAYFVNVFLTGYPVFGVAGTPESADAALMLDTIVGENSTTAQWIPELIEFFRDGLKYNIHGLECEWANKTLSVVNTDISQESNSSQSQVIWNGNVLRRMDMYNTFFDIRVQPREMHTKGEYAGYNEVMSRVNLWQLLDDLGIQKTPGLIKAINESPFPGVAAPMSDSSYGYFIPYVNPMSLTMITNRYDFNWMNWAGLEGSKLNSVPATWASNAFLRTRLYIRIIPEMLGMNVPGKETPQVWKFEILNGTITLDARRITSNHNYLPIFFGQPMADGFGLQTKSFAQNVVPFQALSSAMWNGFIASKRRLIGDRAIYDPSRIREADINSINPAAKIPVRPSAYGKNVQEAVHAFPFRDAETASFIQGADAITRMANLTNNQNPAQQGQFVKGNKTMHEYDDIMGHGNAGNMKMALGTEHQVFVPLKQCLLLNMLQFQQETVLYNPQAEQAVAIKPQEIRRAATQFKVSDGMLPTDKLMSTEEYGMFFQLVAGSPQVAQGYNISPLVSYLMKLKSVDLKPFEKPPEQLQYEQQLQAWQQMAAMAIEAKAPFSTPMPTPPAPPKPAPSIVSQALQTTAGPSNAG